MRSRRPMSRWTFAWLQANGWAVAGQVAGRSPSGGDRVSVTLDRSQWFFDVRGGEGKQSFDLGIILDARSGKTDWRMDRGTASRPSQIPSGTSSGRGGFEGLGVLGVSSGRHSEAEEVAVEEVTRPVPTCQATAHRLIHIARRRGPHPQPPKRNIRRSRAPSPQVHLSGSRHNLQADLKPRSGRDGDDPGDLVGGPVPSSTRPPVGLKIFFDGGFCA